jgi:hypothetical protein
VLLALIEKERRDENTDIDSASTAGMWLYGIEYDIVVLIAEDRKISREDDRFI